LSYLGVRFLAFLCVLCAAGMYYLYLDNLYLVDEVFDGDRLKELTMAEKFTLRVEAPKSMQELKQFVSTYALCQSVYEVQILWETDAPHPDADFYQFLHTHSRFSYIQLDPAQKLNRLFPAADVETEGE
jgi:hypothetical protein